MFFIDQIFFYIDIKTVIQWWFALLKYFLRLSGSVGKNFSDPFLLENDDVALNLFSLLRTKFPSTLFLFMSSFR